MKHRKQVKHHHEPGHLHEFTFSCYKRRPLLNSDHRMKQLARTLDEVGRQKQFDLVAFVFMPEHVHLLVNPRSSVPAFGRYLARIKQPFSRWMKERLAAEDSGLLYELTVQERPGRTCFRFWQEGGGFDRNIYSHEAIQSCIDYIHRNPVQRSLCRSAVDWPWSSARYYLAEPPRQQFPGLPFVHGLPRDALH